MLEAMEWLGLTYDGEVEYQSRNLSKHLAAAEALVEQDLAYRAGAERRRDEIVSGKLSPAIRSYTEDMGDELGHGHGDHGLRDENQSRESAILFRIPWSMKDVEHIRDVGEVEREIDPETPVEIGRQVSFVIVNKKGEPAKEQACLAGFKHMRLLDASGNTLFSLDDHIDEILAGAPISVPGARSMRFLRREVFYRDLVKGEMRKPLDGMKDFVIVRADGMPVFHLANVCDDALQGVTHIIRGDDHVENTFRHILLFKALRFRPPEYAHLPMVVNAQGKPYSKRDGDAFVSDFREQGYLGDALFNYLALLGWSPGDDREIMSRDEMINLFDISQIRSAPTQVDLKKLLWLNGVYMASMPREQYEAEAETALRDAGLWNDGIGRDYFKRVLALLAERIKLKRDFARMAGFFFTDDYPFDEKAVRKRLLKDGVRDNLPALKEMLSTTKRFDAAELESGVQRLAETRGIKAAELIHPLRVAVSGLMEGPSLFEMLEVLGRERVCRRIDRAITMLQSKALEESPK